MVWILVIGIIGYLCYKFPGFRIFTIVVGIIIVLGTAALIYGSDRNQQIAKSLIPTDQVQLTNLRLNKGFSLYQLSGEVTNNSSHELTDITLAVTAYDCPSDIINSDCLTVGQDNNVSTYIDVPPNQVRALNDATYVNLDNMPPIKGTFLWSYKIIGTIGK